MKAGAFPWHACYACDGWPVGPSSSPHLRTPTTPRPQAKKKEAHQKKKKGLSTERHNPRAFSVANIRRTQKNVQRNLDRAQRCVRLVVHGMNGGYTHTSDSIRSSIQKPNRKEHVPLVDRTEELPPPALVVVMGPKGCGKSTLIRSLVKYYTGQNLSGACSCFGAQSNAAQPIINPANTPVVLIPFFVPALQTCWAP